MPLIQPSAGMTVDSAEDGAGLDVIRDEIKKLWAKN
jgi:hypothetical protein